MTVGVDQSLGQRKQGLTGAQYRQHIGCWLEVGRGKAAIEPFGDSGPQFGAAGGGRVNAQAVQILGQGRADSRWCRVLGFTDRQIDEGAARVGLDAGENLAILLEGIGLEQLEAWIHEVSARCGRIRSDRDRQPA